MRFLLGFFLLSVFASAQTVRPAATLPALLDALSRSTPSDRIEIAAGTYELTASLQLKPGTRLVGAGPGKTIITHAASWGLIWRDGEEQPSRKCVGRGSVRERGGTGRRWLGETAPV